MKNSFVVNYAVHLWIASLGVSGPFGALIAYVAKLILGEMLDRGLIVVDIQMDRLNEALKDSQWRDAAEKAYKKAVAKVYTEEEKDAIRKQYVAALVKYARFGDGLRDN